MTEIDAYLDEQGRVKEWPGAEQREAQRQIRDYLARKIASGKEYSEAEVDAILTEWHTFGNPALLRAELSKAGWLKRSLDGKTYRRILFNRM